MWTVKVFWAVNNSDRWCSRGDSGDLGEAVALMRVKWDD